MKKPSLQAARATAFAAVLAASALGGAGCRDVDQRPGLTRHGNEYEQFVPVGPDAVAGAAQATLAELGLAPVESENLGDGRYRFAARNQQDTQVVVRVEPAKGESVATRYTVEVRPGGSAGLSTQVIRKINDKIGVNRMSVRAAP